MEDFLIGFSLKQIIVVIIINQFMLSLLVGWGVSKIIKIKETALFGKR